MPLADTQEDFIVFPLFLVEPAVGNKKSDLLQNNRFSLCGNTVFVIVYILFTVYWCKIQQLVETLKRLERSKLTLTDYIDAQTL